MTIFRCDAMLAGGRRRALSPGTPGKRPGRWVARHDESPQVGAPHLRQFAISDPFGRFSSCPGPHRSSSASSQVPTWRRPS